MGLLTVIRKNRRKEREMRVLFLWATAKIASKDESTESQRDVGGQRMLRPYWRNYFEQTDALVWVVDSSDRLRMGDCKEELHTLLQEDRLAGASLLVYANKQDLEGAMSAAEIRDALDLNALTTHHWKILSCSAVLGTNLVEGLDWVVDEVAGRLYFGSTSVASSAPQGPLPQDDVDLAAYLAYGRARA
ncbi:hypothetical protein FRC00_006668, partial [Tulasnella sp. 408]